MAAFTFNEFVATDEPAGGAFTPESSKKQAIYSLIGPVLADLQNIPESILGTTSVQVGDGRLQRQPPLACPMYPWLYASAISNVQGRGKGSGQVPTPDTLTGQPAEVPLITSYYWNYAQYFYTVDFTPRPFTVATDDKIVKYSGSWYDETVSNGTVPVSYYIAPEWLRYTDYDVLPRYDNVTAQQGQMVFRSSSGSPPAGPDGTPFSGMPKMYLPNQTLKITWFGVPYRYVTSSKSYLSRWLGRINQSDWWYWKKGQLLYIGWNPFKFNTLAPEEVPENAGAPGGGVAGNPAGLIAPNKLCNIEFTFLLTNRTASDLPAAPTNKSYIQAGWNLQPWFTDRRYHYCSSNAKGGLIPNVPSFLSFPIELLFYDPDAGNTV